VRSLGTIANRAESIRKLVRKLGPVDQVRACYGAGPTGYLLRGSSRRITIMRFRPANIRLIDRRSNLPRLLLALSSEDGKNNDKYKNNPADVQELTGLLHIRA
jgi:hypothetical protein